MSAKLFGSDPGAAAVIRDVAPSIATVSMPFYRFGRVYIGSRTTIAKLKSGSLAVISPVPLTSQVKEKIATMGGNVRYIIAPDLEHHMQLDSWHKEYPAAAVVGPEGLPEKRDKQGEAKVAFTTIVTEAMNSTGIKISDEFDAEFDTEFFHTHANKEIVFNKKDERTLIEADLFFNLGQKGAVEQFSKTPHGPRDGGFLSNMFCNMMGLDGNAKGQQRFIWYLTSKGNGPRGLFAESVKKVDKWNFDRVIPCHGDVIETGGKREYQKVMQWYLAPDKTA